jgi:hypothetical protein
MAGPCGGGARARARSFWAHLNLASPRDGELRWSFAAARARPPWPMPPRLAHPGWGLRCLLTRPNSRQGARRRDRRAGGEAAAAVAAGSHRPSEQKRSPHCLFYVAFPLTTCARMAPNAHTMMTSTMVRKDCGGGGEGERGGRGVKWGARRGCCRESTCASRASACALGQAPQKKTLSSHTCRMVGPSQTLRWPPPGMVATMGKEGFGGEGAARGGVCF